MDDLDRRLVAALRRDSRATHSDLATELGVARATVRARMDRLVRRGDILGFTILTQGDVNTDAVRALMMIGIEGRGTERVLRQLEQFIELRALYTTNGRWDVIVELGTTNLATLDATLARIRRLDGVSTSETSLILSVRKGRPGG